MTLPITAIRALLQGVIAVAIFRDVGRLRLTRLVEGEAGRHLAVRGVARDD